MTWSISDVALGQSPSRYAWIAPASAFPASGGPSPAAASDAAVAAMSTAPVRRRKRRIRPTPFVPCTATLLDFTGTGKAQWR
jgi:hypothetical protein